MRIGMEMAGAEDVWRRKNTGGKMSRFAERDYAQAMENANRMTSGSGTARCDSRLWQMDAVGGEEQKGKEEQAGEELSGRGIKSEAEKIYQAAVSGKRNPIQDLRDNPKVPYGHLAKNGVIEYNGVCFVCDEKTNSICLGDMTDEKNVLTITLSGGGHLKVNRDNLGQLSRAAGMFSPEDLNLIMRAIAQDTKIRSVKKEIEDEEASVGDIGSAESGEETKEAESGEEEKLPGEVDSLEKTEKKSA